MHNRNDIIAAHDAKLKSITKNIFLAETCVREKLVLMHNRSDIIAAHGAKLKSITKNIFWQRCERKNSF